MLIDERLFQEGLQELIDAIRDSQSRKNMRATGKSAKSLSAVIRKPRNGIAGDIRGDESFEFQARGRGPGRYPKPSRKLVEAIRLWVVARGIEPAAAYPIAFKVNKLGYRPRQLGVLSDPLNPDNVAKILLPRLRAAYEVKLSNILFG